MVRQVVCIATASLLFGLTSPATAEVFPTIVHAEVRRSSADDVTYDFTGKVDGKSVVVIRAPKGTVKFSTGPAPFNDGSKIDGASKVLIEASRVVFNAKIDGKSIVLLIVPKDGVVEINDKIDGESEVYWCKSDDSDPEPTITVKLENPRGGSKFNQVSRAEMDRLIKEHDLK
ncbi:MAG: hypothetical protein ACRCT8_08340 [Lacipirellulaceae bacterium]